MEDKQEKAGHKVKETKKYRLILIGLLALQVVGLLVLIMMGKGRSAAVVGNDSGNNFFPFWLVLFIPIIIAQRKKKEDLTEAEQKRHYLLMIGLALLVLLGMILFLLVSWR